MTGASVSTNKVCDYTLDIENGLIVKAGESFAVRPKIFETLVFLSRNPNRVVSKDELVQAIWRGAAITDDALTQTISQARKCIGDQNKDIIRTISKRGFFFAGNITPPFDQSEGKPSDGRHAREKPVVQPIALPEDSLDSDAVRLPGEADDQASDRANAILADLDQKMRKDVARAAQAHPLGDQPPSPPGPHLLLTREFDPPRRSIIVLPFDNMGGDANHDYFVDGVTESLTTDLSCPDDMIVIGRNTAFTYKGKAVDLRQIGRELNVRYVLEGSVQRCGNRMRVNVQLVDAGTGNHLWAERFDKTLADLFDMQDEIVAHVANALTTQITETEARRGQRVSNPDAMDLYFQGMAWFNRGPSKEHLTSAHDCFGRAVEVDPDNVWALVGIARVDQTMAGIFYPDDRAERIAAAKAALAKALSLAPNYSLAHLCLGQIGILTKQPDQALAAFERALTLNRNLAHAQAYIGFAKVFVGRADQAEIYVHEALRLSPRDTFAYVWFAFLGYAKLSLGADEEAVVWLRRATSGDRIYPIAYFWLAVALAYCGRLNEAQAAAKAGLSISPTFNISRFRATRRATTQPFLPSANASMTACGKQECLRDERDGVWSALQI
jgi:TolB-like protein/DNA-binding winged helix-turn-helix (wHTH) protein/cytochrome c-type biogenesis protein CcmH/NrfG